MKRVTKEKLLIFNKYGGDPDGFARLGSIHEKGLFEKGDWIVIDDFFQNAELISKRLVSKDFKERILKELKEFADEESFEIMTNNLKR